MTRRQKVQFWILWVIWLLSVSVFWGWWYREPHIVGYPRFIINTLVLSWTLLLPLYFFFFVSKMKRPNPAIPIPKGRVAMVVTKAPSEPWSVVRETLMAMLAQRHPHDTWLADEDPSRETIEWCQEHGVKISTRRGVPGYNSETWPRRKRCKEGNLAYFYDHHGYRDYDYVVQLDADHRPAGGYLEAMLRPFADPDVGYVSAPSICDANAGQSWTARGRIFAEGVMHGALQAGYSDGYAPLCIGSHYAVRTKALEEIGGLGPELAEDHSTTLMMNAHGWRGVHAFDATAHGDGPIGFLDCMTQEFQWSRSLAIILCTLTPRYWRSLPMRLRFQFLFSQLWYPLFGTLMLLAYTLPIFALITREPWVKVSYLEFLLHSLLVTASTLAVVVWLKENGWLRPQGAKLLSWEVFLFQLVRWPWALYGSLAGIVGALRGIEFNFKVTPKGRGATRSPPIRTLAPYGVIAAISGGVALLPINVGDAQGYYFFTILNAITYVLVICVIIAFHCRGNAHAQDG